MLMLYVTFKSHHLSPHKHRQIQKKKNPTLWKELNQSNVDIRIRIFDIQQWFGMVCLLDSTITSRFSHDKYAAVTKETRFAFNHICFLETNSGKTKGDFISFTLKALRFSIEVKIKTPVWNADDNALPSLEEYFFYNNLPMLYYACYVCLIVLFSLSLSPLFSLFSLPLLLLYNPPL